MGIKDSRQEVKSERAGDWFESVLSIHTPLSPNLPPIFFYLNLFNSVAKKPFLGGKNIWWGIPTPQRYIYASNSLESDNLWQSQQSSIETGVSK